MGAPIKVLSQDSPWGTPLDDLRGGTLFVLMRGRFLNECMASSLFS